MNKQKDNSIVQETDEHTRKKVIIIRILILVTLILLSVILCLTTILFINGSAQSSNDIENGTFSEMNFQNNSLEVTDTRLKIIQRIEWLAQPPEHPPTPLKLPVSYVIILHTATNNCTDRAKCTAVVRFTQTYHMESRGWWDIGYNFLVGGDGYVYEGRGWKGEGAHVYGWNSKSIGIAFIGTFGKNLPPNRQILACKQLIERGVQLGYVANNYKLFAQRQLSSTQSPGEALYENIKTWPHWTENSDEGTT